MDTMTSTATTLEPAIVTKMTATNTTAVARAKKVTELEVVDYELLRARDQKEIEKLIQAATTRGIFFLDLTGPSAAKVRFDIPHIIDAQRNFFDRPLNEKQVFESPVPERGYEKHDKPNVETLLLSREEQLNGSLKLPRELHPVADRLANVSSFSDGAMRDMFRILCTFVDPPIPTAVADDPYKHSYTNLTLGRSLESVGEDLIPEHADSGILTILYYDLPSLEILEPTTKEWEVVQPRPGLQAVYIGQHFQASSNGRFKAALHRVVQPEYGAALVVYLLHPQLEG